MRRRLHTRAVVLTCVGALAFIVLLVASGGCEAIVGGGLPDTIVCVPGPSSCPAGQACVNGVCTSCNNGACKGPTDSGSEDHTVVPPEADAPPPATEASDEAAPPPPDTGPTLKPLGAPCAGNADCRSHVCGDQLVLGADVIQKTPNMTSVCTKPCCISSDCTDTDATGFVCHGTGTGGNYCVNPAWVNRSAPGMAGPGASCPNGAGDCRSGACNGGKCQDTCCHPTDCTNGTTCNVSQLDGHQTFNCSSHSITNDFVCFWNVGGADGDFCNGNNNCQSSLCGALFGPTSCGNCVGACCKSSDCPTLQGTTGNGYCVWAQAQMPAAIVLACATANPPGGTGTKVMGDPCTKDTDCVSGTCNTDLMKCSQPCCMDGDCRSGGTLTWFCRPKGITLSGGGSATVLICQP